MFVDVVRCLLLLVDVARRCCLNVVVGVVGCLLIAAVRFYWCVVCRSLVAVRCSLCVVGCVLVVCCLAVLCVAVCCLLCVVIVLCCLVFLV